MLSRREFLLGAPALAAPALISSNANALVKYLRIGHNGLPATAVHVTSVALQKFIAERSSGAVQVDLFPNSILGNEGHMSRAVADGSLDGAISPNGAMTSYSEEVLLTEYPFFFRDLQHARASLDGKLGKFISAQAAKNKLLILGFPENGLRHITATRAIRTPADLKDLKLRVQPIKIHVEVFKALGAQAAPMVWTELPAALRSGRFEAHENPVATIAVNDFLFETQSHLSLTGHIYSPYCFTFSKYAWERLAAPHRDLLMEGVAHAVAEGRRFNDTQTPLALQKIKSTNMAVVTDVDTAAFRSAVEKVTPQIAQHMNAELFKQLQKLA